MTESSIEPNSLVAGEDKQTQGQALSSWKKAAIVFVLSILVARLGQLYAKRIWRGLAIALSVTALAFVGGEFRVLLSLVGMTTFPLAGILLPVWIAGDASHDLRRGSNYCGNGCLP